MPIAGQPLHLAGAALHDRLAAELATGDAKSITALAANMPGRWKASR